MKRSGYISWDEYFMGACIVDSNNIILSTGYNGFPYGCSDDLYPWEREGEDTKYNYVVHAELNAILNARGKDLKGARLYVDLFPCNECAKAIIQSGIAEVVYLYDKYADSAATVASKKMLTRQIRRFRRHRRLQKNADLGRRKAQTLHHRQGQHHTGFQKITAEKLLLIRMI